MKLATLFSGIGTPEMAASKIFKKVKVVFACEIDKFARKSYEAIYGESPLYTDVHDLDGRKYRNKVTLLVGGSPCQSFSFAGLRKGLADERGQLIYQFYRIVDEMRPKVFLFENVKGFRTIDKGETRKQFEESFRRIGYTVKSAVLNTKDYGLPQNRERYFLIGFSSKKAGERFEFPAPVPLEKTLADIIEDDVDEKYYLSEKALAGFIRHDERHKKKGTGFRFNPKGVDGVANTIRAHAPDGPTDTFIKVAGRLNTINGHDILKRVYDISGISPTIETMSGGSRQPKIIDDQGRIKKKQNPKLLDVCPTLRAQSHGNEPKIIQRPRGKNNGNLHLISPTVSSNCFDRNNPVYEAETIRRLTPKECWRLQGFPDWAHDAAKEAGVSDTQRYKQAGNAMSVNVIEAIMKEIKNARKKYPK